LQPQQEQPELNFRLGEAMKMADLMTSGYAHLLNRMLPDSLNHYNDMEKSGYFDKPEMFRQSLITDLPILWKTRSVPALEHFIRSTDYESADQIIDQVTRHVTLLKPVWEIIQADTAMSRHFSQAATHGNRTKQHARLFTSAAYLLCTATVYIPKARKAVADAVFAWSCAAINLVLNNFG
jgi:hypothetical protein